MSWFMAAIYDRFMRDMERACGDAWRKELLSDLRGDVLEIGAGTGRNLDHYAGLDRLVLAEPDPHMRTRLDEQVRKHPDVARAIEVVPWESSALGVPDASLDAVVSTLVLCSVPDVARTLDEARRVLKPGGRLIFLEHVKSPDPNRQKWQRRVEPAWKIVAGNCHLCRETEASIEQAGFHVDRIVRESARKALPIVRATIRGSATKA